MPMHYAISDALVVLAAAWGTWRLVQSGQPVAALGVALFGIAGAIGTIRLTSGLVEQMASVHRFASQIGGLAGIVFIVSEIARSSGLRHSAMAALLVTIMLAGMAIAVPTAGQISFLAVLLGGTALLWRGKGQERRNIGAALCFGLMLPNVLLVRQSSYLGADVAWHLYHVIVALWLISIATVLSDGRVAQTTWKHT